MSESDSDIEQEDEDILCRYGSALTPYEAGYYYLSVIFYNVAKLIFLEFTIYR